MLARLHVLLPYHFTIPEAVEFTTYYQEHRGYEFRFLPPGRSDIRLPADPPEYELDDKPCYLADVLVIEFKKDSFERGARAPLDPPAEIIKELITWFLERCRYVLRAPALRPLEFPEDTPWRITYTADDGTELPGGRGVLAFNFSYMILTPGVWEDIFNLPPDFEPPVWEMLLLDAHASLPAVGSAVTLTATALEVFVSQILDALAAKSTVSATLWAWVNDRGFHLKEPSSEEQFDILLKELLGVSLKTEPELWKAFKCIREARNSFVHSGRALLGKTYVNRNDASDLIRDARKIISFVRERLPDDLKWVTFEYKFQMKIRQLIRRERDDAPKPPEQN